LSRSYLVELPGIAHDPTSTNPCGISLIQSFLQNPNAAPDTSCVAQLSPVFAPQMPPELIALTNPDVPAP
jgi:hypothetical protein